MERFGYYSVRLIALLFSFLPFGAIYRLSDLLFFFLYRVIRYRLAVVYDNLKKSFPEKTEAEIQAIARKYYHSLCDNILETIKGLSMDEASFRARYRFSGTELLDAAFAKKQNVMLVGGHLNNWEWGGMSISLWLQHTVIGIYKPLKNKLIDAYYYERRSRFGTHLTNMKQVGRAIVQYRNQPCAYVFIADQIPSDVNNCHWVHFLHRETAFLQGADKIARSTNYPVFYFDIKRTKRGYYEVIFSELIRNPAQLAETEVTTLFAKCLEQSIQESPADWLWSHKRWKREKIENSNIPK